MYKIKPQSFKVIPQPVYNDKMSVYKFVERMGRVCYDSFDKITSDSYTPFITKLIQKGHLSVMEQATFAYKDMGDVPCNPYLYPHVEYKQIGDYYYTVGNYRTLIELYRKTGIDATSIMDKIDTEKHLLSEDIPRCMRRYTVEFRTNRAMSHQLVRHRKCSFLQRSQRYCREGIEFILPVQYYKISVDSPVIRNFITSCESSANMYTDRLTHFNESPQLARGSLNNDVATTLIMTASIDQWKLIFDLRCGGGADPQMKALMTPVRDYFIDNKYYTV